MNLKYEFNFNNNNLQAPLDILRRMDYNWLKSSSPTEAPPPPPVSIGWAAEWCGNDDEAC